MRGQTTVASVALAFVLFALPHAVRAEEAVVAQSDNPTGVSDDDAEYLPLLDLPEEEVEDASRVVQRRLYHLDQELALVVGIMPADPYYKSLPVGASYSWHFSDHWAWQVFDAAADWSWSTKLREELRRVYSARGGGQPEFHRFLWTASTRLVWKPLYGKQAVFNVQPIHIEGYLMLGPTVGQITGRIPKNPLTFGVDAGFGLRLWMTRNTSVRMEVMELVHHPVGVPQSTLYQSLHLQVALAMNLGGDE